MSDKPKDVTPEPIPPRATPEDDPQWERAHQAWHLIIHPSAHELSSNQQRALFKIVRAKRSEQENLLRSLPGTVRKGARIDLAPLERGLNQAGISCSLKYVGARRGDPK